MKKVESSLELHSKHICSLSLPYWYTNMLISRTDKPISQSDYFYYLLFTAIFQPISR